MLYNVFMLYREHCPNATTDKIMKLPSKKYESTSKKNMLTREFWGKNDLIGFTIWKSLNSPKIPTPPHEKTHKITEHWYFSIILIFCNRMHLLSNTSIFQVTPSNRAQTTRGNVSKSPKSINTPFIQSGLQIYLQRCRRGADFFIFHKIQGLYDFRTH